MVMPMKSIVLTLVILGYYASMACTPYPELQITDKSFQTDFVHNISRTIHIQSKQYFNRFLEELSKQQKHAQYQAAINGALEASGFDEKLLVIKQLVDSSEHNDFASFYALRNANFLKKLRQKFRQLEETVDTEMRNLRWYELCKNFHRHTTMGNHTADQANESVAASAKQYNENALDFGRRLYDRVKISGAAIIDDYLNTLRKLLIQVIDEADDNVHTIKSTKILTEIDALLATQDFYEKRQRLYTYLQGNLAADYELFQSSHTGREDLEGVLEILRQKSWDLVVNYVFSNAEFLEHLHDEWRSLLPANAKRHEFHTDSQVLYDVHYRYVMFRQDHENLGKYESYMEALRDLKERAEKENSGQIVPVYDLLYSASQNIGATTLNMMRQKCEEF